MPTIVLWPESIPDIALSVKNKCCIAVYRRCFFKKMCSHDGGIKKGFWWGGGGYISAIVLVDTQV